MAEDHPPCKLVMDLGSRITDHQQIIGEFKAHLCHIRKSVDNGLSKKLDEVKSSLDDAKEFSQQVKRDLEERTTSLDKRITIMDEQSWLPKLLTMGTKKLILLALGAAITFMLANGAVWGIIKSKYFEESPGQQKQLAKIIEISSYHTHQLIDGGILTHAGDPLLPAYEFDPKTGKTKRVPNLRTEEALKDIK